MVTQCLTAASGCGSESDGCNAVLQWHPLWLRRWRLVAAGFLSALDEDQADMFTQSELHLSVYGHALDHRLLTRDILGYPSLFGDILG